MLRLAEFPDVLLALFRLRLGRIDDERVMHLVVVAFVEFLGERAVLVGPVSEERGRAYGDHGDGDDENDKWHRHIPIVYWAFEKGEFDMPNFDDSRARV